MDKDASSKKMLAYNKIKENILTYKLNPGEPIVERTICEELVISRTPIRAAFTELSKEGLVDIIEGRGVFVSKIRFEDMMEVYDIREALECMSISLMTERLSFEELEQLKKIYKKMELCYGMEFMSQDMEFHTTIALFSKNKRMAQYVNTIYSPIRLMAATGQGDAILRESALKEHAEILAAVATRDVDAAVEAMRKHIRSVKQYHIKNYFMFSPSK